MSAKKMQPKRTEGRVPTGISGLDEILNQGLIPGRVYLVRGGPGTGKSILGLHFLTAGTTGGWKGTVD